MTSKPPTVAESESAGLPEVQINVVWSAPGAEGDRVQENGFKGPLPDVLRDAIRLIEWRYRMQTVIYLRHKHPDGPRTERFWNFPIAAIREALTNAVFHRSYEEQTPVEVRVTRQEVAVKSFPGPDPSIRLEDLQAGRAVGQPCRNPRIGEILKELDLAEGRSTGIPKMLEAMRKNGSPAPVFESDEDHTWFLVRLPVHKKTYSDPTPQEAGHETREAGHDESDAGHDSADTGHETGDTGHDAGHETARKAVHDTEPETRHEEGYETGPVTEHVERLVAALTGELSRPELQAALGLSGRGHFLKAYLHPALAAGLIEMTLPDKPTSRKQRYRRTAAGEALAQKTKDLEPST